MEKLDLPEQVAGQPLSSAAAQALAEQAVEVHTKVVQSAELLEAVTAAVWVPTACTCTSKP